jgi:eukaryotic translation initiation factor 2C
MDQISKHPFNGRSFFPNTEASPLGIGLEARRGFFQSVRPGVGNLFLNFDITSAVAYQQGPLMKLCLDFLGTGSPNALTPALPGGPPGVGLDNRDRVKLARFITGMKIAIPTGRTGKDAWRLSTIKGVSAQGADTITFEREGEETTVADYFARTNRALRYPRAICIKVGFLATSI